MQYDKLKKVFTNHYPVYSLGDSNIEIIGRPKSKYYQFKGDGQVIKISRGEKMDIIDVKFGMLNKIRHIVVINSLARRQILTLKKGQWGHFYGQAKLVSFPTKDRKHMYPQWCFSAYIVQGYYVPKMFDVKKLEEDINNGEEKEQITELANSTETFYQNVVDGLFAEPIDSDDIVLGNEGNYWDK